MFDKDTELIQGIQKTGRNVRFFKDLPLSPNISAVTELTPDVVKASSVVIYAIPTQIMKFVLPTLIPLGLNPSKLLVFVNKGIESGTARLPDDVVRDTLGQQYERTATFLSGPSFAEEVINRMPTAVSVASHDPERAEWCQRTFHAPHFRVGLIRGRLLSE
jgi:glycerol-3-phosphate dehydrogenase